jgi:arylsulfatase A
MKTEKPNIIIILADDMGYGDASCLNDASKINTVHMDQMAADGIKFTDAHASSSVCTPSRYGILTGRYAWRGALRRGVLGPYAPTLIEEEVETLPQKLKEYGYNTAIIGKWHLGMDWSCRDEFPADAAWGSDEIVDYAWKVDYEAGIGGGPRSAGFDYYFGVDVPNFPPYCFIENRKTFGVPTVDKPDTMFGAPGPMLEGWDLQQIMPELVKRTENYIREQANNDQPFFLYFSLTGPHNPICPTPEFRGKSDAGIYGDFVLQMDDAVGRVRKTLEECGITENTLVLFASDNGSPGRNGSAEAPGTVIETFGHSPSWILRGMKADTWDGGHRIPFFATWPGHIKAGSECDQLTSLSDIFATCMEIVGGELPGTAEDTINILPYLEGEKTVEPLRKILVHHGLNGLFGIRHNQWKYIAGTGSGGFSPDPGVSCYDPEGQLYDMDADIREKQNLYFEESEKVHELRHMLLEARDRD